MCGENINYIPHCNGRDYWLLVGGTDSLLTFTGGGALYVYVFLVTDTSITYQGKSDVPTSNYFSAIKVSPNGQYVFTGSRIYRFNRINGDLITHATIDSLDQFFSSSFSPDSRFLYALFSRPDPDRYPERTVFQYDLSFSDPASSAKSVGTIFSEDNASMQLGPDNKIYIAQIPKNRLAVISDPNQKISIDGSNECNFTTDGPLLSSGGVGGLCAQGLPNFSDVNENLGVDFTYRDSSCGHVKFSPISCLLSHKWFFGDGDSATGWDAEHTYAVTGDYTVTFIAGLDTVSKVLHIGTETAQPIITGDSIVCDTAIQYFYSVGNIDGNSAYSWIADSGAVFSQANPYEISVKWHNSRKLKLIATDQRNGCKDSSLMIIVNKYNITNTLEDSIRITCTTVLPDSIIGSVPFSEDFQFTYQWKRSTDSISWTDIPGGTSANIQPDSVGTDTIHYQRFIYLGSCDTFISNTVTLIPVFPDTFSNMITLTDTPIMRDCGFDIEGTEYGGSGHNYYWQYSLDSSSWVYDSTVFNTNKPDYTWHLFADTIWMRRLFTAACISDTSNIIRITPKVVITKDAEDYASCNDHVYFNFEYYDPESLVTSIMWFYRDTINTSAWSFIFGTNTYDTYTVKGYEFYYQVNTPQCACASPHVFYHRSAPSFTVSISDSLINDGDSIMLIATGPSSSSLTYQWEKRIGSGTYYQLGTDNDTLVDSVFCAGNPSYRVVVTAEACPPLPSQEVTINTGDSADLWSKDTPLDAGDEPNLVATNGWSSEDIWNNKDPNVYSPTHQNPEFKTSSPNKLFARVRNRGTGYSKPSRIILYYTLGGGMQTWPTHWVYDLTNNGFYNAIVNDTFPMGSEIDTIIIHPLAPGTDTIVSTEWYPPNPENYYITVNGVAQNPDPNPTDPQWHMCFLSRIETCDEEPYGMTFTEGTGIIQNIKNNNNIVSKNTTLVNEDSGDSPWREGHPVIIGRNDPLEPEVTIRLNPLIASACYFNYGTLSITLDDSTYAWWQNGGSQGSGFIAEDQQLIITDISEFEISNIVFPAVGVRSMVAVEFDVTSAPLDFPCPFEFEFAQYTGSSLIPTGGVTFSGIIPAEIPGAGGYSVEENNDEESPEQNNPTAKTHQPAPEEESTGLEITPAEAPETGINTRSVIAYPNPFSKEVNFAFSLGEESDVDFEIYNSIGIKVGVIINRTYNKGRHIVTFDGSTLAPGAYFCKVNLAGEIQTLRIILNR